MKLVTRQCRPVPARGFTLIELMVAVVVIGILAAVAYPAYTSAIARSRRADAVAVLTAVVQAQERYRSNRNTYTDSLTDLKVSDSAITKHYSVKITDVNASGFTSGYEAAAAARSDSPQINDGDCATIIVRVDGALLNYSAKDKAGAVSKANCWSR